MIGTENCDGCLPGGVGLMGVNRDFGRGPTALGFRPVRDWGLESVFL